MAVVQAEFPAIGAYVREQRKVGAVLELYHTLPEYGEPAQYHVAEASGPAGIDIEVEIIVLEL